MANVTIHADASRFMAVHAPTHRLVYFAPYSMHLANLTVTCRALDTGPDVRLVRVVGVRFRFDPVHALPRGLLFSLGEPRQLLNFRALGLD